MRKFLILILLMPIHAFAEAPECPIYQNKKECLLSVAKNFEDLFKDIVEESDENDPEKKEELIQASFDIKKYETLACQRTCLN